MDFTPDQMDALERALVEGDRVQLSRRGTEYVIIPQEIKSSGPTDCLVGLTSTGDELSFDLLEIDRFSVLR